MSQLLNDIHNATAAQQAAQPAEPAQAAQAVQAAEPAQAAQQVDPTVELRELIQTQSAAIEARDARIDQLLGQITSLVTGQPVQATQQATQQATPPMQPVSVMSGASIAQAQAYVPLAEMDFTI